MNVSSMGSLSPAMMQQVQQKMFAKADVDHNGGLSLEEFSAAGPPRGAREAGGAKSADLQKMFAKMDADGDGALTQAEMQPKNGLSSGTMAGLLSLQGGGGDDILMQMFASSEKPGAQGKDALASTAQDLASQLLDLLSQSSNEGQAKEKSAAKAPTANAQAQNFYRFVQDSLTAATSTQGGSSTRVTA